MLRITTHETDEATVLLKLEGKLLEPWVDELRCCAIGSLTHGNVLKLDLSALAFADAEGTKLLLDLIRQGATLAACSGYIAALLHVEKS